MASNSFFSILSAGYIKHYADNRIFLNEYYTKNKDDRQKYDLVFPKQASGNTGLVLCIRRRLFWARAKTMISFLTETPLTLTKSLPNVMLSTRLYLFRIQITNVKIKNQCQKL